MEEELPTCKGLLLSVQALGYDLDLVFFVGFRVLLVVCTSKSRECVCV